MPPMLRGTGHIRPELLPVQMRLPSLHVVLAPHPRDGERPLPRVPHPVRGRPPRVLGRGHGGGRPREQGKGRGGEEGEGPTEGGAGAGEAGADRDDDRAPPRGLRRPPQPQRRHQQRQLPRPRRGAAGRRRGRVGRLLRAVLVGDELRRGIVLGRTRLGTVPRPVRRSRPRRGPRGAVPGPSRAAQGPLDPGLHEGHPAEPGVRRGPAAERGDRGKP
mmetsp:Transcript_466/g.1203  ORF Transcript_466/g.1203 Transcript_466/m.1203 type:complete len:217 (+) Transcript_466:91-741(+)